MNGIQDPNQAAQIEAMKKQILSRILEKEALERLSRVRVANPQLASQVELYLIRLFQSEKIPGKVGDSRLKDILAALTEKRDIRIKRK